jgi:predicted XRE-type DNA-binding protein
MTTEVFESVWKALEDTPTEAENMKLRSSLMIAITEAVSGWRVTQTEAAKRLGVTQPRLNDPLRGRVGKFSLDALLHSPLAPASRFIWRSHWPRNSARAPARAPIGAPQARAKTPSGARPSRGKPDCRDGIM